MAGDGSKSEEVGGGEGGPWNGPRSDHRGGWVGGITAQS